jgi:serine/threonine protein phosphatase PrpC
MAVAIADGHGDQRHDRSRIGSALAVQAAVEELVTFHRMYADNKLVQSLRGEFRADFPRRVTRRWREAVDLDARGRDTSFLASTGSPDSVYTRYGSTLLAALVTPAMILIGQIGDGDIVIVRPDGTLECPIATDTSVIGKETRSLSSRDAHLLWRMATLDRGSGGILIMATDGVSDSFDASQGEEFLRFVTSLADRVKQYGIQNVADAMSGWLDRYSELASGDDMTLVLACINPEEKPADADLTQEPAGEPAGSWGF